MPPQKKKAPPELWLRQQVDAGHAREKSLVDWNSMKIGQRQLIRLRMKTLQKAQEAVNAGTATSRQSTCVRNEGTRKHESPEVELSSPGIALPMTASNSA
jgi:hypothetical protein